jgi:hypothetical protein
VEDSLTHLVKGALNPDAKGRIMRASKDQIKRLSVSNMVDGHAQMVADNRE